MTTPNANGSNVALTASTRPSSSTDKQVGSVELKLGEDARVIVEVRAATKALAVQRATKFADTFMKAARGDDSAATNIIRAMVPSQVSAGLKLASSLAKAAGVGKLRGLWSRLPRGVRSRVGKLAKDLTA